MHVCLCIFFFSKDIDVSVRNTQMLSKLFMLVVEGVDNEEAYFIPLTVSVSTLYKGFEFFIFIIFITTWELMHVFYSIYLYICYEYINNMYICITIFIYM